VRNGKSVALKVSNLIVKTLTLCIFAGSNQMEHEVCFVPGLVDMDWLAGPAFKADSVSSAVIGQVLSYTENEMLLLLVQEMFLKSIYVSVKTITSS
jgi:hypothetical protein